MRLKVERIAGLFSTVVFLLIGSLVGVSYAEDDKEGGGDKETTEWFNHLGSRTMERWPDDFAGLKFVEPGTPLGGVEIRFSEGAEEKVAEIAKEAPQPELLIPVNVPKSQAQIAHEMALVISDREEAKRGFGPLAETRRDVRPHHAHRGVDASRQSAAPAGHAECRIPGATGRHRHHEDSAWTDPAGTADV